MLGHLEELRSLLAQSSWDAVSPLPTMLQVLLFFLRCVVPSPSDPDSHWTWGKHRNSTQMEPQETARTSSTSPQAEQLPVTTSQPSLGSHRLGHSWFLTNASLPAGGQHPVLASGRAI